MKTISTTNETTGIETVKEFNNQNKLISIKDYSSDGFLITQTLN